MSLSPALLAGGCSTAFPPSMQIEPVGRPAFEENFESFVPPSLTSMRAADPRVANVEERLWQIF